MEKKCLTAEQARHQVAVGRPVEQLLEPIDEGDERVLRWVTVVRTRDGRYEVRLTRVFDAAGDSLDLYDFTPVEDDDETIHVEALDDAFRIACDRFGAVPDRFLPSGKLQDAYAALRRR